MLDFNRDDISSIKRNSFADSLNRMDDEYCYDIREHEDEDETAYDYYD